MLFLIRLFGTVAFFQEEVSRWLRPELASGQVTSRALDAPGALLAARAAGTGIWMLSLPGNRGGEGFTASWIPAQGGRAAQGLRTGEGRRMLHAAIVGRSLVGFALLFLAMSRHQQDWLRRKLSPSLALALRPSGFATLGLAFVLAGTGLGWAYAALVWYGWLTLAAALVAAAHSNRERILHTVRR